MAYKIHIGKFLNLLKKATLNWSIPNVRLTFTMDKYHVGMKGTNSELNLTGENDIITGINASDEWEMNFQDVVKNVKTYMSIILPDEDGMADIKMMDGKVVIKSGNQKTQCFFCSDSIPTLSSVNGPRTKGDEILDFEIDEEFVTAYNLIEKVARSFGKVYFGVADGKFFIEAGDRTSPFSNNMLISLQETDKDDMFVCFDYKTLKDIMTILSDEVYDFKFRLGFIPERNSGLISFIKEDNETYYLVSLRENI